MIDITQKYRLIIDTLSLVLLPAKQEVEDYNYLLDYHLEELEGDAYTFLHSSNINELVRNDILKNEHAVSIKDIRKSILELSGSLWNSKDFVSHPQWNEIRNKALNVIAAIKNDVNS